MKNIRRVTLDWFKCRINFAGTMQRLLFRVDFLFPRKFGKYYWQINNCTQRKFKKWADSNDKHR